MIAETAGSRIMGMSRYLIRGTLSRPGCRTERLRNGVVLLGVGLVKGIGTRSVNTQGVGQ